MPGTFRWQPGVLTTAVSEGRWILVEDINLAPTEVVSILIPLLESRTLFIPSRGEKVLAHENFRIFSTRTTGGVGSKFSGKSSDVIANGLWDKITVKEQNQHEILEILCAKFPSLQTYNKLILLTFQNVLLRFSEAKFGSTGRTLTLRDLLKWCKRLEARMFITPSRQTVVSQTTAIDLMDIDVDDGVESHQATEDVLNMDLEFKENLFRESLDCFVGMIANVDFKHLILNTLGESLMIPQHRLDFFFEVFVPILRVEESLIQIGRTELSKSKIFKSSSMKNRLANTSGGGGTNSTFATLSHSLRLMEKLSMCIYMNEPCLLVGETGTGKTTVVQHLAHILNKQLHVVNMSQQSDSSDLLGGFKPVDVRHLAKPLKDKFEDLFKRSFSAKKNQRFLDTLDRVYVKGNWEQLCSAFGSGWEMAKKVFQHKSTASASSSSEISTFPDGKRVKTMDSNLSGDWERFREDSTQFEAQLQQIKSKFMFNFVEGTLVKAVKNGDWVLLDEVNLASSETLECLSGLLQSSDGSILLMEKGDTEPVERHPEFRLFACMNPANDAGKRDLPPGLRSRFSEFWVESPDSDLKDLAILIQKYIKDFLPQGTEGQDIVSDLVQFYVLAKKLSLTDLYDGANHRVHFSIRTLSRALSYASSIGATYGLKRSLYEGLVMTFLTQLNKEGQSKIQNLIDTFVLKGIKNPSKFINMAPKPPREYTKGDQSLVVVGEEEYYVDSEKIIQNSKISQNHVLFHTFWIQRGPLELPMANEVSTYVLTPSVQNNLVNLARAVMSHRYPILIQGPTSAGKTSMIEYIAKRTGHRFVRINNHEHTDLQEYVGSYVADDTGKLVFREGILVQALRNGYWIVLDELNLAPSDVLEALNRLLDDNRELFIPETQEIIRPHPQFLLFATQNPPGLYGGRKVLSRAFRNRFLELHFDDIPQEELGMILEKRCLIAPSYANKIVGVYKTLRSMRQKSKIFDGKHGYITLRDLFRWAERRAVGYEELAQDGYMILADKIRKEDEKAAVIEALESNLKVKLDIDKMYEDGFQKIKRDVLETYKASSEEQPEIVTLMKEVVWTKAMKRLFTLVAKCIANNEPVLLVGETGCGKTTVCQVLAAYHQIHLHIVNAHQHSETSDFLGSQRPIRGKDLIEEEFRREAIEFFQIAGGADLDAVGFGSSELSEIMSSISLIKNRFAANENLNEKFELLKKMFRRCQSLFEWNDGSLVIAMKKGDMFLLDEISLADDSVLERLNSVLEPQRLLVLAEKASENGVIEELNANDGFQFLATMNPGGDYGKKELSPALRNRFTEIWAPQVSDSTDLIAIINSKFDGKSDRGVSLVQWEIASNILRFVDWFAEKLKKPRDMIVSLRDILAWTNFITFANHISIPQAFIHGGCLVLIDGIGVNPLFGIGGMSHQTLIDLRHQCEEELQRIAGSSEEAISNSEIEISDSHIGIQPFLISLGPYPPQIVKFSMRAPTTTNNCLRVLRALQLRKPVLLEGSPGVGKTSLIASLSAISGRKLVRINLSDQTDLTDLFGSDLPVEDDGSRVRTGPEFAWRDGPLLQAMKNGDWILLDELNLANQQVLEGLNACLDHRGAVYIPELQREFKCSSDFRIFAAQNPQHQGGGRKGLPKSFVNRFTQVYVVALTDVDLEYIVTSLNPRVERSIVKKMIAFVEKVNFEVSVRRSFGWSGSPWEFNLRDVLRWVDLMEEYSVDDLISDIEFPGRFLNIIFLQRMRSVEDRLQLRIIFKTIFGYLPSQIDVNQRFLITPTEIVVNDVKMKRNLFNYEISSSNLEILQRSSSLMQSLMYCVKLNWMVLLTGSSATGKTSLIRLLSKLSGNRLEEFAMNGGVDTIELLGGFEQADLSRRRENIILLCGNIVNSIVRKRLNDGFDNISINETKWIQHQYSIVQNSKNDWIDAIHNLLAKIGEIANLSIDGLSTLIEEVLSFINHYSRLMQSGVHGSFEWIDGTLIRALEEGHWVLIDNVNFCSPSVLDRLNPLFEPNGCLMVNERGLVNGELKIIYPHPNFRLFLTMDPKYGDISRAMRNRSTELSMTDAGWVPDEVEENVANIQQQDLFKVLSAIGLHGDYIAKSFLTIHQLFLKFFSEGILFGLKSVEVDSHAIVRLVKLVVELLQRGESWETILSSSFDDIYGFQKFVVNIDLVSHGFDKLISIRDSIFIAFDALKPLQSEISKNFCDVGTKSLQILASPSLWPTNVNGKLFNENSTLAEVALVGSLFENLMYSDSNSTQVCSARLKQFLKCLEYTELETLLVWIAFQISKTRNPQISMLKNILGCILQWIKENGNISSNVALSYPQNGVERESILEIWSRLISLNFEMKNVFSVVGQLKVSQLSLVQRSFAFNKGKIGETQILHEVIKWIYPLSVSLKNCLFKWITSDEFLKVFYYFLFNVFFQGDPQETLHVFEMFADFWIAINKLSLEFTEFAVVLKRLFKSLQRCSAANIASDLSDITTLEVFKLVEEMENAIDLKSISLLNSMWRSSALVALRTERLFATKADFLFLDKMWKFETNISLKDWLVKSSSFEQIYTMVSTIEGCSTLYFLNEQDEDSKKLLDVISNVPSALIGKLKLSIDNLSKNLVKQTIEDEDDLFLYHHIPLECLSKFANQYLNMSLIPILDALTIEEERKLIFQIVENTYSCSSFPEVKEHLLSLLSKMISFFTRAISSSYRPPLTLEPFKRLIWMCEKEADGAVEDQKLLCLFRSTIKEAAFNNNESSWDPIYSSIFGLLSQNQDLSFGEMIPKIFSTPEINFEIFEGIPTNSDLSAAVKTFSLIIKRVLCVDQMFADKHDMLRLALSNIESYRNELFPVRLSLLIDVVSSINDGNNDSIVLSKFQIGVSMSFLNFYVPEYPVDPSSYAFHKLGFVKNKIDIVSSDISTNILAERLLTGNFSNHSVLFYESIFENLLKLQKKYNSKLTLRPIQSQIVEIHKDLQQLVKNILPPSTVESVVVDLLNSSAVNQAQQIEKSIQETLTSFIAKLQKKYPHYFDILNPLINVILIFKNGLSILSDAKKNYERYISDSALQLLQFNGCSVVFGTNSHSVSNVRSAIELTSIGQKEKIQLHWDVSMALLIQWGSLTSTRSLEFHCLLGADDIFQSLIQIWSESEEKRKQEEIEKDELYKFKEKEVKITSEEEFDEEEMLKSFPDYHREFSNSIVGQDTLNAEVDLSKPSPSKESGWLKIESEMSHKIRLIHKAFVYSKGLSDYKFDQSWAESYQTSFLAAYKLLRLVNFEIPKSFEFEMQSGLQFLTSQLSKTFKTGETSIFECYNFYYHSNINETKQMIKIFSSLDERISSLLEEWPDHMMLLKISELSRRIISFPISSPLPKFMVGLEMLLQKIDDWEKYASKAVSLKIHIDSISQLVVQWRKLELQNWRELLDLEDNSYYVKSSDLWFHLYKIVISLGVSSDSNDNAKEVVLDSDIFASFDQVCQSSNYGEFQGRLELLEIFSQHLKLLEINSPTCSTRLITIRIILDNVYKYYHQFLPAVLADIKNKRKKIMKELQEYVQIASWKDISVFALKESSTRTHHHLHKFLKKYREILGISIREIIQQEIGSPDQIKVSSVIMDSFVVLPEIPDVSTSQIYLDFGRFTTVKALVSRMNSIAVEIFSDSKASQLIAGVNELVTTVIERIQEFTEINVSLEAKSSTAKSQKMVRKKALVDLLKGLEYLGIPTRSHHAAQNQNNLFVFTKKSPNLRDDIIKLKSIGEVVDLLDSKNLDGILKNWTDSEDYFFKLLTKMAKLRTAVLSLNNDISDREMEKSSSYCEELLHYAFGQREWIGATSKYFVDIGTITAQFSLIYQNASQNQSPALYNGDFESLLIAASNMIDDFILYATQSKMVLSVRGDEVKVILSLDSFSIELEKMKSNLRKQMNIYISKHNGKTNPFVVHSSAGEVLEQSLALVNNFSFKIETILKENSQLAFIFNNIPTIPIVLKDCFSQNLLQQSASVENFVFEEDVKNIVDGCVSAILVSTQELRNKLTDLKLIEDLALENDQFGFFQNDLAKFQLIFGLKSTHFEKVVLYLRQICSLGLSETHKDKYGFLVCRLFPLLNQYFAVLQRFLFEAVAYHRSICKLDYVLSTIFKNLFEKGYCLPKNSDEQEEGDEQEAEGTGIGEGKGTKDISDQIEEQDEVEGMKDEKEEKGDGQPIPEEDNAIEMDMDFDGELEDVKQNENDETDDNPDEKDEDAKDMDEQMGDLDLDESNVVDEALWGDDEDKGDSKDEKKEKDSSMKTDGQDLETVANEDGDNSEGKKDEKDEKESDATDTPEQDKSSPEEDKGDQSEEDGEDGEDEINENNNFEENTGVDVKDHEIQPLNDEEELDLPEDMNFDDQEKEKNDVDDDGFEEKDSETLDNIDDDGDQDIKDQPGLDQPNPDVEEETAERFDDNETSDLPNEDDDADEIIPEKEDDNLENSELKNKDGGEKEGDLDEEEKEDEDSLKTKQNEDSTNLDEQPLGVEGSGGAQIEGTDDDEQEYQSNNQLDQGGSTQQDSTDSADQSHQQSSSSSNDQKKPQKPNDPNPNRSLGDAKKEWMSRLKSLKEAPEDSGEDQQNDAPANDQMDFEYVTDENRDFDAQALDVATMDQVNEMNVDDLKSKTDDLDEENLAMDEEDEKTIENENDKPGDNFEKTKADKSDGEMRLNTKDTDEIETDENLPMDNIEEDAMEIESMPEDSNQEVELLRKYKGVDGELLEEEEEVEEVNYEKLREELELSMRSWHENHENMEDALNLWRTCCNLTRELSFDLCEQLRLILEPTLATKLKGDYKTGKRLNMRKVIPYIASEYKKDKIWMRRTKPSKRCYQILIAIDDSQSMGESRSIQLAYQSLALISKALSQLEAGEMSIVSFGEEAKLLHPFDRPFNDEAGASIIQRFKFDQNKTKVKELMETSLEILDTARKTSSGDGDLWQLQIVISDGICENHDEIRNLVRRAADQRIMVVFLVLDNRKESVTKMASVSYEEDSNGKVVLKMEQYMDSFPFDYYITLGQIDLLPDVLSQTLRQYFTLVGQH